MASNTIEIFELGQIISAITPPKKIQTSDFLERGDFPIIDQSVGEIAGWINDESALVHPPEEGLIVFGDHTCVLKFLTEPFAQGADGIKIIKVKKGIDPYFVFAHLTAFPLLNDGYKRHFSELKRLRIRVPDLKSQTAIAQFRHTIDSKIAVNEALCKTLEELAVTIFNSWFISFDPIKAKIAGESPAFMDDVTAALFPGSMDESELGLIPKGWSAAQLNSVLILHKVIVKAGIETEFVPYVPVDQISSKEIFLKSSAPGDLAKTSLVSFMKNDILFGAMRPYFHKVTLAPFDGTTRTTTFVLRPKNQQYLAFGLFTVFQERAVAYATSHAQGSTIPYAVWNNSFENFPTVVPTLEIASEFNKLVKPMIEYGYSLVTENRELVQLRDSLLPRLISGELEIPEDMLAS